MPDIFMADNGSAELALSANGITKQSTVSWAPEPHTLSNLQRYLVCTKVCTNTHTHTLYIRQIDVCKPRGSVWAIKCWLEKST